MNVNSVMNTYVCNVLMVHSQKLFHVKKVIKWYIMMIQIKETVLYVMDVLKIFNINVLMVHVIEILSVTNVSH